MALRLVAVLVAISLMGSLPVRAEQCEPTTAPCHDTQPQSMNCCQPTQCHCNLSTPVPPAPDSVPASANTITGHELVKVASLPMDAMFLMGDEYLNVRPTAKADTSLRSNADSYLLTHAFLI
ncbi:MAG TPA: hypothetical protein VNL17_16250 [Verrucomicrobiae bacterium]|nr:hypothetical protein [Verrucomicrobiae bacterium]